MTVLVIAEHQQQQIQASTLNVISAALQIDQDVELLLMGENLEEASRRSFNS